VNRYLVINIEGKIGQPTVIRTLSFIKFNHVCIFWQNVIFYTFSHKVLYNTMSYTGGHVRFLTDTKITRYDYNLTIMKSPKPATDTYQILMISDNVEFLPPHFYAVFWQPFWKWQTSWKFWKRKIAPLMVTYHYVKIYVSIIIQLEVININVRNFKFPIGFYSNPHPLWTPKNMALTPFTTNLKTLGSTRNIYL
jgi:hypothetical protein